VVGLPGHWTSHQWTSSYEATWKPWFTHRQSILKRQLLPVHWGSSNRQTATLHFWAHTSTSPVSLSALYWGWLPQVGASALNWYEIQLSFRILQWLCLISNLGQTHLDCLWNCKDTCTTYSCLTTNFCFSLSYHLTKFRHGVFLHSVYVWRRKKSCKIVWWYVLDLYSSSVWTNSGLEHWLSSLWFSPVPPGKYENSTSIWPWPPHSESFLTHHSAFDSIRSKMVATM